MVLLEEVEDVVPGTPSAEDGQDKDAVMEEAPRSKSSKSINGNDAQESEAEAGSDENEEDEDGDEEEYEIEAILDAKRGYFKQGKYGYLVSWKGYGPEHNSWVDEDDAGNAEELIREFWLKRKEKEKTPRASGTKPKTTASAKGRKSMDKDSTPAAETSAAKRGRARQKVDSDAELGGSDDEDDEDAPKRKKKRPTKQSSVTANGTSKNGRKSLASVSMEGDGDQDLEMEEVIEPVFTSMKALKHGSTKSWEDLVKVVTTVERVEDDLMVYFELVSGEYVREKSAICAKRFPQKLIQFYESNLRWRAANNDE